MYQKKKLRHISERFSKDIDINIAFSPLKRSSFFSCMATIPKFLQSYVIYQFSFIGYKAYCIIKAKLHLNTRIEEHLGKDKKSNIYIYVYIYIYIYVYV